MIIVIEPHADDAFLSLGGHIERWIKAGSLVRIVTVFSGTRKRGRDAEAFSTAVGASWVGLGAREPDAGGAPEEGKRALFGKLVELISTAKKEDPKREIILAGPLGIKHPEHREVRQVLEDNVVTSKGVKLWYYLDQPYAATQANGEEVNVLLGGLRVVSYLRPNARKYRHIPLFKDQAKFFYYNPAEKLVSNIELISEV